MNTRNDFGCDDSTINIVVVIIIIIIIVIFYARQYRSQWLKIEWWGAGMVVCLERGAELHIAQLMPLPLTISLLQ